MWQKNASASSREVNGLSAAGDAVCRRAAGAARDAGQRRQHPQLAGHDGEALAVDPGPRGLHVCGPRQNAALERASFAPNVI